MLTIDDKLKRPADLRKLKRQYRQAKAAMNTLRQAFGIEIMLVVGADIAESVGQFEKCGLEGETVRRDLRTLREALK